MYIVYIVYILYRRTLFIANLGILGNFLYRRTLFIANLGISGNFLYCRTLFYCKSGDIGSFHYYWRTPEHLLFSFSSWYRTIYHLCMFTLFMSLLLMSVSISHMKQICTILTFFIKCDLYWVIIHNSIRTSSGRVNLG